MTQYYKHTSLSIIVPFTVYSYEVKCLHKADGQETSKQCPKNMPCKYDSHNGKITMGCGSIPQADMPKIWCKGNPDMKHWKCYCNTPDCNHKCEYDDTTCVDDFEEDGTTPIKTCEGTCMPRSTNTKGTMKTMKTEKTMEPTKMTTMKSKPPVGTTTKIKDDTEPNGMGTTSKSSTTNAAAFHVVVGMVIIIAMQFP